MSSSGSEEAAGPGADPAGSERVTSWKGLELLPFQIRAIEAVRAGLNTLVSAPTGAGKTLIAEFAIADAVARGRRCVYTAPIKALSNQKYRDFRDDPAIDVGLMTGDVTIRPGAQVLIMTTEILRNSIFENPRGLADVEYVILDEIHFMDDQERGSVWEESLIFAPAEIRFIALSATIENLDQLGAWMREIRTHELEIIRSKRRPVPLKHRLFTAGSGLFPPNQLEAVRRREGGRRRARFVRGPAGRRRGGRAERELAMEPERPLLDELQRRQLLPALVFAFSRKDCERLAARQGARVLLDPDHARRMEGLLDELFELFQVGEGDRQGVLFRLAARGVAYHHAGLLPIHKEIVERLFTSGLLRMLFTTETFALGINMPARAVVFHSLRKFDGLAFDYLRTRDYLQMAGRAGRQGIDSEGLVISLLDPRDLVEAPIQRILSGKAEPILSRFRLSYATILNLHAHIGAERLIEAWERSFNQFQHRAKSRKKRERNRRIQDQLVRARLGFLESLGYIDADGALTPRGETARRLYGFELQVTEMLYRGTLEPLPPAALAVIFVGLVHEERGRRAPVRVPSRIFGGVRRHVDQVLGRLADLEAEHRIPETMKLPDWGLAEVTLGWCDGAGFDDLEGMTDTPAGDICRNFRMALQLMRQVRRALAREDALAGKLEEAMQELNRGEVDARRQLELG